MPVIALWKNIYFILLSKIKQSIVIVHFSTSFANNFENIIECKHKQITSLFSLKIDILTFKKICSEINVLVVIVHVCLNLLFLVQWKGLPADCLCYCFFCNILMFWIIYANINSKHR